MDNMLLKYNSLDPVAKKQVRDYIDHIFGKMKVGKKNQNPYKKRILTVSSWSEQDIKPIKDNQSFNQFKPEEW